MSGGRNAPLRGSKGSLYEGGVRVNAFIYSPLLSKYAGTIYSGLFHVSDWFPTLLGFGDISFTAKSDKTLDGIDQSTAMTVGYNMPDDYPREYLLYNMYTNVSTQSQFDIYNNSPVAIRNTRYKLLHAYTGESNVLSVMCSDMF